MKIEIKCRFTMKVLFECEAESIKLAVEKAVSLKVNLSSADLHNADLSSADLSSADLSSADLSYADLSSADLSSADLSYANLRSANLRSANLISANLSSANLSSANLRSANLRFANLSEIKKDFIRVISAMKPEIVGLFKSLHDGKIDGSKYEGDCACLKGTLSKYAGCPVTKFGLENNSDEPSERWFMGINPGDTPANNQISKITCEWVEEFCKENEIKLPTRKVIWESTAECP